METGVEIKKVDAQGRLILPADWREAELNENKELGDCHNHNRPGKFLKSALDVWEKRLF
jgi:DNA-binding transcriptional regulator/RsmH inhibitor MraZ